MKLLLKHTRVRLTRFVVRRKFVKPGKTVNLHDS